MRELNPMEAMLQRQRDRALARLAQDPNDRMAELLVTNREQALADIQAGKNLAEVSKYHLL